ncbi:MAG: asparagine synthase (glutamine-hydrolyzing) [Pseudomonadota bacterium]
MCGIAGIVAFRDHIRPDLDQLRTMCDSIVHRGPDDFGYELAGPIAMGMRRLAIIDPEGGKQPVYNEDRSIVVVLNGEIYNYRALRSDLEAKGHSFRSNADTEVLPHLWEEYGVDFAAHLNGMFAIALHDKRAGRFALVRDHVGIKPLFYSANDERLVFGSEVKALLASGLVDRQLDVDALGEFIAWEYVPAPKTLLADVRKLEPGHLLEVDLSSGKIREHHYWDVRLDGPSANCSEQEWTARVDAAIKRAVQAQLVSDVPLGAFLSGGVDSSLVVADMGEAQTFSIGFDDPSYNELEWSKRVAEHLGVRHDFDIIKPHVADLFDRLMNYMDDPIGDFSIFPTYLVSRHARRQVTVALSGDGGDELFGGYETYLAQAKARQWSRLPRSLRESLFQPLIERLPPAEKKKGLLNKAKRFVEGLDHDPELLHTRWRLFAGESQRQALFSSDAKARMPTPIGDHILRYAARANGCDEVTQMLYIDVKSYLVDNCLVKMDRMSMACSLEARVPLLDKDVVDLAFRIPSELKIARGETKSLLKRVAAQHVPSACVYRPKEGFSIPIKQWLKTDFRPLMEELLAPTRLAAEGLFQPGTIERLKSEHLTGRANHSHILWAVMVFQDWRQRWQV